MLEYWMRQFIKNVNGKVIGVCIRPLPLISYSSPVFLLISCLLQVIFCAQARDPSQAEKVEFEVRFGIVNWGKQRRVQVFLSPSLACAFPSSDVPDGQLERTCDSYQGKSSCESVEFQQPHVVEGFCKHQSGMRMPPSPRKVFPPVFILARFE